MSIDPNVTATIPKKEDRYLFGEDKELIRTFGERTMHDHASFLLPYLRPETQLLDAGCGPGSIIDNFASVCHEGRVVGIDESTESIAHATKKSTSSGATFMEGSVYDLPFENSQFDVVFSHQVLQYLSDPVRALKEFRRVLKPGGIVAVRLLLVNQTLCEPMHPGQQLHSDTMWRAVDMTGGDQTAGRKLPRYVREAGFEKVDISAMASVFRSPDIRGSVLERTKKRLDGSEMVDTWRELGLANDDDLNLMKEGIESFSSDDWAFVVTNNMQVVGFKPM